MCETLLEWYFSSNGMHQRSWTHNILSMRGRRVGPNPKTLFLVLTWRQWRAGNISFPPIGPVNTQTDKSYGTSIHYNKTVIIQSKKAFIKKLENRKKFQWSVPLYKTNTMVKSPSVRVSVPKPSSNPDPLSNTNVAADPFALIYIFVKVDLRY